MIVKLILLFQHLNKCIENIHTDFRVTCPTQKDFKGKIGFIKEMVFPSVVYMVAKRLLDENYNFPTYMVLPVIITIKISSKVIGALAALFFTNHSVEL